MHEKNQTESSKCLESATKRKQKCLMRLVLDKNVIKSGSAAKADVTRGFFLQACAAAASA